MTEPPPSAAPPTEQRKPNSLWFFSLRRQQKPKKLLPSKKQKQKSCADLSTLPTDARSLPTSVTNSPKLKKAFFRENRADLAPLTLPNGSDRLLSADTNSLDSSSIGTMTSTATGTTPSTTTTTNSLRTFNSVDSINDLKSMAASDGETVTTTTTTTKSGKTYTTITRVTKTTVITKHRDKLSTSSNRINRIGTIFDEHGKLLMGSQDSDINSSTNKINRLGTIFDENGKLLTNLNELDVYKNYSNNFRSNIIKNDSASSCSSGSQLNIIHINNNNNHIVRFADDDDDDTCLAKSEQATFNTTANHTGKALSAVRFLSVCDDGIGDDDSGKYCKRSASINSITGRPFKSSSLDDDIEFIDTSSSLSDIGGGEDSTYNSIDSTIYYNTLPKLPKSCATCKAQQQQQNQQTQSNKSKSEWNISINNKQMKNECEMGTDLDIQEDCKHSNNDKRMSNGRKKFNMDPKKGIEFLCENNLLRMDAQDVAHFLYKGEGLNKTAIGDYLGEKNDFNEQVLKAFVELHDFTNLILVQALRQFLWSFRLPGEAQKIDRMMECFAQRYCQLNPNIFTNTDTCYVLSFAIIMLNTSLHNPSVKDKPSVEQFISMNRGINNGGDLPRELLVSLYESIRAEPFTIPQDDGNDVMHTFFNPDKEGWLWKQGGRYKSWKRRWFILNDNCLYYFEYTTDKEPRGIIPLENVKVREIHDRSKSHCFELYACGGAEIIKACKTDSDGKVVEGKHSVYRMSAATEEDKLEWMKRLEQSISKTPFLPLITKETALVTS